MGHCAYCELVGRFQTEICGNSTTAAYGRGVEKVSRCSEARVAVVRGGSPHLWILQSLAKVLIVSLVIVRPGGQSAMMRDKDSRRFDAIQPTPHDFQDVDARPPALL